MPKKKTEKTLAELIEAKEKLRKELDKAELRVRAARINFGDAEDDLSDFVCRNQFGWGVGDVIQHSVQTGYGINSKMKPQLLKVGVVNLANYKGSYFVSNIRGTNVNKDLTLSKMGGAIYGDWLDENPKRDAKFVACKLVFTAAQWHEHCQKAVE